ncbi:MAG: V-type ATP synthase subunit A [Planctomycetota bacterium]
MNRGTVTRVSGPIVDAEGLAGASMYEVVEVGADRIVGEVIRVTGDVGTVQVYENTGGLRPGAEVRCTGAPLSLALGPGLIGNIYDGIQRPLKQLHEAGGPFLARGQKAEPLDVERRWPVAMHCRDGDEVEPGQVIATLGESAAVEHRAMVPAGVRGTASGVVADGEYTIAEPLCRVGGREITLAQRWPVRTARPFRERHSTERPLVTGQRVIDTLFPIARGGTAAIPGGFGTGKTITQHALAKWSDAEIIVYVGCGERGNEMTQVLDEFPALTDPRSGRPLMERTVLIANTSNMPVAAREVSIYTGITIAEYYRDMGYHVAVMADSTSRWAEALRELGARLEEMPAEEGFPAYLPTRLAQFYERGGAVTTLDGADASVTIIGSISPQGGDFTEPVTQHTRRFTRCFWALNTELANARHYPAIHWLDSYSEYVDEVEGWWAQVAPNWAALRQETVELLQREDRLQQIVKLVGPDVLPDSQRLVLATAQLIKVGFLQQNAFDEIDMYSTPKKQTALLDAILEFHRRGVRAIENGAPLVRIMELECRPLLLRAKSEVPNDDEAALAAMKTKVMEDFAPLEAEYR